MAVTAEKLFCKCNQVSNFTLEVRVGNVAIGSGGGTAVGGVKNSGISFVTMFGSVCDHLVLCIF